MPKPIPGEWIEEEFLGIAQFGIKSIVSLLEMQEAFTLGLAAEQSLAEKNAMEFISFPIPDRGLPASVSAFAELTKGIYQDVIQGKNTVIHCRAGIGRTGMIAAGVLLHHAYSVEKALELISLKRRVSVPDTQEQVDWLINNAKSIISDV